MRKAFIDTVTELARTDPKVMVIIGDTGFSVFEEFEKEFGKRFVNAGIAEQNFVSFGAGLSAMGMKPFLYNVVSFMTLRGLEEIILDICYQNNPVVLVGVGGGFAYGTAGPTHHGPIDVAIMRAIPNMTVICPGDPKEMREAVLAAAAYGHPVYIRIGRNVDPVVHKGSIEFQIGKAIKMQDGQDVALLASGTMLKEAAAVTGFLEEVGISVELYSVHTIKPLDVDVINQCRERHKAIFTLEEHSLVGGLGSAVAEVLAQYRGGPRVCFKPYGIKDQFAPVTGDREYLNRLNGIDPESVSEDIKLIYKTLDGG